MSSKINTIVMTVGTSLLGNFRDKNIYEDKEYIINYLSNQDVVDKKFGAELNSFNRMSNKCNMENIKIYLISTDTDSGRYCSEIIKNVIVNKFSIKMENIEIVVADELSDKNFINFATRGLRNLVNEVTKIIKNYNPDNIAFLPIGGYKAEIALITTIANVFEINSYYMYEDFEDIIKMPFLPVILDYELIVEDLDLFFKLKNNELIELDKIIQEKINNKKGYKTLMSYEKIDNKKYLELTSLGLLFAEKLELDKSLIKLIKTTKTKTIINDMQKKSNEPSAEKIFDDIKFKNLMQEILDTGYVEKIICNYYNPHGKGNIIEIKKSSNFKEKRVIKVVYNNNHGIGEVELITTARNELEVEKLIEIIQEKIKK